MTQKMNKTDPVEQDYKQAVAAAERRGDNDACHDLAIGLKQYREFYKTEGN